jgi:hypothetical protein
MDHPYFLGGSRDVNGYDDFHTKFVAGFILKKPYHVYMNSADKDIRFELNIRI